METRRHDPTQHRVEAEPSKANGYVRGAYNAHDALVAALRDMLALERDRASGRLQRADYERRIAAARAALTLAEEE